MKSVLFYAGMVVWIVAAFVALSVLVDLHGTIHGAREQVETQHSCPRAARAPHWQSGEA